MPAKKKIQKKRKPQALLLDDIEIQRIRRDINRSDMENLRLFTQMLRLNSLFKKATVTHK
jgi:hypothetical protein